jgi:[acyl-carrier-protein] S-malonyltransferase
MENDSRAGASALVFPGMGPVPFAEVGRFLLIDPRARELLAAADDVLGYSLFDRCREAEDDYSEPAQVAFLVTCLALAYWAHGALGVRPQVCTGPSFGGKAAAVYSGALDFADGVRLTAELARCEQDYFAEHHADVVTHSFTRTPRPLLDEVLAELEGLGEPYEVSCYIDEDFYMLSLREDRLDWLQRRLRAGGGLPLYTMRPPMHSAAFGPLRDRVEREVLSGIPFADPRIPVLADQDGAVLTTAASVRQLLLDGIVRPVRWPEVVASLQRLGVGKVYVAGPDGIFGRVRCTTRNFETIRLTPKLAVRPRQRPPLPAAVV